jgi:dCTP deaminase
MILSDQKILEEIEKGTILIEPFNRDRLGTNSYDVHLGKHLDTNRVLDARQHNKVEILKFLWMDTNCNQVFYLGVTEEYTETHAHIPFLCL